MYPYLVADIGGTNARFAIVTGKKNQQFQVEQIQVLSAKELPTFAEALHAYLATTGVQPRAICVAIAGPILGDQVRMTNLNWTFSRQAMAKKFGVEHFVVMNDFAAVASASAQVTDEHLITIKDGIEIPSSNKAVFGAGTGLGVAGLVHYHGTWVPVPSEGGHINIAPATDLEADIIKAAMTEFDHVSAEAFVSGPGLVNIYQSLCAVHDVQPDPIQPAQITEGALAGSDALLTETLTTFCSFSGSFAGNLALLYGAQGGVFMAGGVMPRFADFLIASPFSERFNNKGVMSHYVEPIPAKLMVHPETAFIGAAGWLEQQLSY